MSRMEMTYCDELTVGGGAGRPTDTPLSDGDAGGENLSSEETGDRGGDAAGGVRINTRDEEVARMRLAAWSMVVPGVMV